MREGEEGPILPPIRPHRTNRGLKLRSDQPVVTSRRAVGRQLSDLFRWRTEVVREELNDAVAQIGIGERYPRTNEGADCLGAFACSGFSLSWNVQQCGGRTWKPRQ